MFRLEPFKSDSKYFKITTGVSFCIEALSRITIIIGTVSRFCGILTFPQLYSMTASCMDVVNMPSSAIVYTGDCGTVSYPSQLQRVASRVLCNPAK